VRCVPGRLRGGGPRGEAELARRNLLRFSRYYRRRCRRRRRRYIMYVVNMQIQLYPACIMITTIIITNISIIAVMAITTMAVLSCVQ